MVGSDTYDYYYNDQWQVLEIRKNGSGNPWKQYAYHPDYVDAIAVRFYDENTDGAGIVEHYYLQDANFNVTAVADDSGAVVERYTYNPYGEVTFLASNFSPLASTAIANELLYTGRRRDPETGLQLNRNRFYHQQLGRWTSQDPIGYEGSQWNLYEYVNGMPTYYVDPMGLRESPGFWELYWHYDDWENRGPISKACVIASYGGGAGAIGTKCIKKCIKKQIKKKIKWTQRYGPRRPGEGPPNVSVR